MRVCSEQHYANFSFSMQPRYWATCACHRGTGSKNFGGDGQVSTAFGSTSNGGSAFDGLRPVPKVLRLSIITEGRLR